MPEGSLPSRQSSIEVEVSSTVKITVNDREPIERVTGPNGDEWRAVMYPLRTEDDVLRHWARNAVENGVVDVASLDGWADVPVGTVTFRIWDSDTEVLR